MPRSASSARIANSASRSFFRKAVAVAAGEAADDPIAALEEAVLLLDRLHPLVHLGFPEVDDLFRPHGPAPLERLLQREDARVRDEEVLLQVAHRLEERLDGLGGALDDVLEGRDALQEVLVERNLLLGLAGLLDDADAREDEELGVAARAELFVVGVLEAADLAVHQAAGGRRQTAGERRVMTRDTRRSRGRTSCRASRRRPCGRAGGSAGISGRRIPPAGREGWRGRCPGR